MYVYSVDEMYVIEYNLCTDHNNDYLFIVGMIFKIEWQFTNQDDR